MKSRIRSQAGVGIVELLVGLAISLVLMGGIYQIFIGSTTSYALNERLSRLQENGRFALYALRNEVRGAGYLGCFQDTATLYSALKLDTATTSQQFMYDYGSAVWGFEATAHNRWSDGPDAIYNLSELHGRTGIPTGDANARPLSGTDILTIRNVGSSFELIVEKSMPSTSAVLKVAGANAGLNQNGGEILLVTDCRGATIFQSTGYKESGGEHHIEHNSGSGNPGNKDNHLGQAFSKGAQIFFPRNISFYVRKNPAGEPSLYRKVNQENAEELVEGVESMQIRYGVDTTGDRAADVYVAADTVTDWDNVMSVRIGLLMRTVGEIPKGPIDTALYDVDGDGATELGPANDRRLRMVVSGTVGLRNRLR